MNKHPQILILAAGATAAGCIGGRFDTKTPAVALDRPTRAIVDRITTERAARGLPPGDWVPDLGPTALRAATAVARGDQSLKTAANLAAQNGVTELGRHLWSFATDCIDIQRFRSPAMVTAERTLLFAAAAVPGPNGHTSVLLLIAEPGTSALRADQMGGGHAGSNPALEIYAHPSVATGPCGESWPTVPRIPL